MPLWWHIWFHCVLWTCPEWFGAQVVASLNDED